MRTVGRHLVLAAVLGVLGFSPCAAGDRPVKSDKELFQGTWVCVAALKDGKVVDNYVGVRAVIDGNSLTWYFPKGDGSYREQKNEFRIDSTTEPKHFDWWPVDKPESVDRRIYSFEGGGFRWGTNLDGKTRPKTFESARWQFTMKRARPTKEVPGSGGGDGEQESRIEGWGAVINPDGDCTIRGDNGKVTITVPGSLHDLWYGRKSESKRYNAPRVLREVEGDFVARVKVTADWKPAGPPTASNYQYIGAGLVVWDSGQQYLRLERNVMNNPSLGLICYTTPLYDRGGKRVNNWKTGKAEFFQGPSTWLRVERAGQTLTTAISPDGKAWSETGVLTTEFPKKVQVGILAINCSTGQFVVGFEGFKVLGD